MAQSTPVYLKETAAEIVQTAVEVGKDAIHSPGKVGKDALHSTVEVGKGALSNLTHMSRDFLVNKGYLSGERGSQGSRQHIAIVHSGNQSPGYGFDYISIFLGATGYYVASSMNLKSYSDITLDHQSMPTHVMWGVGFGLATTFGACLYAPYSKWVVATLIGYKIWADIVRPKLKGDDELHLS